MVTVDAINEKAGFYTAHGFVRLPDCLHFVLPMRPAAAMVTGQPMLPR
jgi:hypothetical protein